MSTQHSDEKCQALRFLKLCVCRLTTGWTVQDRIPVGTRFSTPSRPALGPTQPPVQWVPSLSQGKVRPGRGADHSPPSSAAVMEE